MASPTFLLRSDATVNRRGSPWLGNEHTTEKRPAHEGDKRTSQVSPLFMKTDTMGTVIQKKRGTKGEQQARDRAARFRRRGSLTAAGRRSAGTSLTVGTARGPGPPRRCTLPREHRPLCPGKKHMPLSAACAWRWCLDILPASGRPWLLPSLLGPSGLFRLPRHHHSRQLCT